MLHRATLGGVLFLSTLLATGCQRPGRRAEAPPREEMPPPAAMMPPAPAPMQVDEETQRRLADLEDNYRKVREDHDRVIRQVSALKLRVERMESAQVTVPVAALPNSSTVPATFDPKTPAAVERKPYTGDTPAPAPAVVRDPTALIEALRNETNPEKIDALAKQVAGIGGAAAPALIKGLNDDNFDFRARAEKSLSIMPARECQSLLLDELKRNQDTRIRVVRIFGMQGDPSAVPHLFTYLGDKNNAELRFAAAASLVQLRAKEGIPILIEALKSPDHVKCALSFDTLHRATGQDLGYKYYGNTTDREFAAKKWEIWWRDNSSRFEFAAR